MINLTLTSLHEEQPGAKWQRLCNSFWPHYKEWFLSEGHQARPGYLTSRKKLRQFMPELLPTYEQLVELAGGGDLVARFLSMYCPPPYMAGCSQAVWSRSASMLVRNYDYSPKLFEGNLLFTSWHRPVIAMIDSLWGVLDGINQAGLVVSLTFGGRKIVGEGFGIPLILRYILEFCDTTSQAIEILRRVPAHMTYNVTVLDLNGQYATIYLSPHEPVIVTNSAVGTNHQQQIEWPDYARLTSTVERENFLEARLADSKETARRFIQRFLQPPLYNTQYEKAFGTLYTAVYQPGDLTAEFYWPNRLPLRQSFADFTEQKTDINLRPVRATLK